MGIIQDILAPLQYSFGIDHIAYHRYNGPHAEAVSSDYSLLEFCLQSIQSVMPVERYEGSVTLRWNQYLSQNCLSAIEADFRYNSNGVTFLLKHADGFSEHVAFTSCNQNLDLMSVFNSDAETIINVLSHVRSIISKHGKSLNWLSYNRERYLLVNSTATETIN